VKLKLRGQEVFREGNILRFTINKPLGNVFSISDSIKRYIDSGCEAKIKVGEKEQTITKETPFIRKESVKSKFPESPDWYRYWYSVCQQEQSRLF
jgi:hypothetical protein